MFQSMVVITHDCGREADNRCKIGSGGDACYDKSEFRVTVQRCRVESRLFGGLVEAIESYFWNRLTHCKASQASIMGVGNEYYGASL